MRKVVLILSWGVIFIENMRELASDLVKKAKEIDALIEVLPGIDQTEDEQVSAEKKRKKKFKNPKISCRLIF